MVYDPTNFLDEIRELSPEEQAAALEQELIAVCKEATELAKENKRLKAQLSEFTD